MLIKPGCVSGGLTKHLSLPTFSGCQNGRDIKMLFKPGCGSGGLTKHLSLPAFSGCQNGKDIKMLIKPGCGSGRITKHLSLALPYFGSNDVKDMQCLSSRIVGVDGYKIPIVISIC